MADDIERPLDPNDPEEFAEMIARQFAGAWAVAAQRALRSGTLPALCTSFREGSTVLFLSRDGLEIRSSTGGDVISSN